MLLDAFRFRLLLVPVMAATARPLGPVPAALGRPHAALTCASVTPRTLGHHDPKELDPARRATILRANRSSTRPKRVAV